MPTSQEFSVLIVDDDADAGENLRDILVDLGFRVEVANNGQEALRLALQTHYQAALLDLKMPGMDGLTLAGKLKERSPSTVVVLTTAYANTATLESAQSHGITRVFPKPLDLQQIIPYLYEIQQQPLVLLIDDDGEGCRSLADVLKDQGFRVAFATKIEDALSIVQSTPFEIILIDMKLPGGYGDEVFQSVRQISEKARVVMVTGYQQEMADRIQHSLRQGADAVCYKPFLLPELLRLLRELAPRE